MSKVKDSTLCRLSRGVARDGPEDHYFASSYRSGDGYNLIGAKANRQNQIDRWH